VVHSNEESNVILREKYYVGVVIVQKVTKLGRQVLSSRRGRKRE